MTSEDVRLVVESLRAFGFISCKESNDFITEQVCSVLDAE